MATKRSSTISSTTERNLRGIRWLFLSVPLALIGASLAAYFVQDIAFFEAWPALNVAFLLLGFALVPVLSPTASLSRKLVHIGVFAPLAAWFIAVLIGAAFDRYYGNDLLQTFYLRFRVTLVAGLSAGVLYAAVVGAIVYLRAQYVSIANKKLTEEKQESDIARQLTETKLRLLQAQIEPHFLFNTLASAQQLASKGAPEAAKLIGDLVRFLRIAIPSMRDERGALQREFDQIAAYLAIMQTRMGDRLQFSVNAPPALADFSLPPALAMTLVENAIKHGIEPSREGGRVEVTATCETDRLLITVADSGVGLIATAEKETGSGLGLANISQRLQAIYGNRAKLSLKENPPHGCIATLSIPLTDDHLTTDSQAAS
jgi:signal transduction histidine kinase